MGFAVLHLDKAKGTDSGMSAHIERRIHPANADESRTHLNQELIRFEDGVTNRTQAIVHRIATAGIKRKIRENQVRAIRAVLSGSHADMVGLDKAGRIDEWCKDNVKWLQDTFGEKNIVSAVLHMDETTPHIHATIIPIVKGERRRAADNKKKKEADSVRLCADDVMTRQKLKDYQTSYAVAMAKYGLQRGLDGSEAQHIPSSQYYKELMADQSDLQENINALLAQQEEAQRTLAQVKKDIATQELKGAVVNAGTAIAKGVGALFGNSKAKRVENERNTLQQDLTVMAADIKELQAKVKTIEADRDRQLQELQQRHEKEVSWLKGQLAKIFSWYPSIKEKLHLDRLCTRMGFSAIQTTALIHGKAVDFAGQLYSEEYKRHFTTEAAVFQFDREHDKGLRLFRNRQPIDEWFKVKWTELVQRRNRGQNL